MTRREAIVVALTILAVGIIGCVFFAGASWGVRLKEEADVVPTDAGPLDAEPPVIPCAAPSASAEECPKLPSHHCGFQPLLEDEDYCAPNICIGLMTEVGLHCMVNPRLRTNLLELERMHRK